MTSPDVTHPEYEKHGSYAHLKLGANRATEEPRMLLADYLDMAVLPKPPDRVMWGQKVPSYGMDGNDELGDCTAAAMGHMIQTWTEEAGKYRNPSEADVIKMYWETGTPPSSTGTPGGPTDTGRELSQILNYMQSTGLEGDKIMGSAAVNLKNHAERDAAHWLFGGLYLAVALPITAQTQQIWSVVPGDSADAAPWSWGGHCVPTVGRWTDRWQIVTWGARLNMTENFMRTYVVEAHVAITLDWLNAQDDSPIPGVNLDLLEKDMAGL